MSIIMDSFEFMETNNQVYYSMHNYEDRFKPKKFKPPFRNDIYPETFDKGDIKACKIWNREHRKIYPYTNLFNPYHPPDYKFTI